MSKAKTEVLKNVIHGEEALGWGTYVQIDLHVVIGSGIIPPVASLLPGYKATESIHGFVELFIVLCCRHQVGFASEARSLWPKSLADGMDRGAEPGRLMLAKEQTRSR